MSSRIKIGSIVACTVVALGATTVGAHDWYPSVWSFNPDLLCQRDDESMWRDLSNGCTGGDDPRCHRETGCSDSTVLTEGWRHACTWLLFDKERAPSGPEPHIEGQSSGRGCAGQADANLR